MLRGLPRVLRSASIDLVVFVHTEIGATLKPDRHTNTVCCLQVSDCPICEVKMDQVMKNFQWLTKLTAGFVAAAALLTLLFHGTAAVFWPT